ncbi:hypothetical protein TNCV_1864701 [Trichonephila clavipes]|nr:hypothetical protein TNCV_1864701 [Trichonephila clavipes]
MLGSHSPLYIFDVDTTVNSQRYRNEILEAHISFVNIALKQVSRLAVRMTSHNRSDDSLNWRAIGTLETGQCQTEGARSGIPVVESMPNKWYQEDHPMSPQSINICIG